MTYCLRGYHATTLQSWNEIVRDGFKTKFKTHHWLGQGVYFYQEAPRFARHWATKERHEGLIAIPAIIEAGVEFDGFFDLLDFGCAEILTRVYDELAKRGRKHFMRAQSKQKVLQGKPLAHPLDRYIVDATVRFLAKRKIKVRAIRAVFFDGKEMFPKSHLYDRQHVQIAVRDTEIIAKMKLLPFHV